MSELKRPEIQVRHRCYLCGWQSTPDPDCTVCGASGYTHKWVTLGKVFSDLADLLEHRRAPDEAELREARAGGAEACAKMLKDSADAYREDHKSRAEVVALDALEECELIAARLREGKAP